METIFDHNATKEEIIGIVGSYMSKELYERVVSKKKAIEDIYYLYLERDDEATANRYLDMLPNDKHKFFQILNVDNGAYKGFKVMRHEDVNK